MPNKYLALFEKALTSYRAHAIRPGYPDGIFTRFRHSFALYPSAEQFYEKLKNTLSDEEAQNLIRIYFNENTKFNNHSLNTYFLDELLCFEYDVWKDYDGKKLVFYQGQLFRGCFSAPQNVFTNGFVDGNPSNSVEKYISNCNGSVGISTTKNKALAYHYAVPNHTPRAWDNQGLFISPVGYIYEINYRGFKGLDLEAIHTARKNTIRSFLSARKSEVNIMGNISPEDVVRVWKYDTRVSQDVIEMSENPNYQSGETNFLENKELLSLFTHSI